MTVLNKENPGQTSEPLAENEDLDQIMNEIQEIQQTMDTVTPTKAESASKPQVTSALEPTPSKSSSLKGKTAEEPHQPDPEDILKEMSGSSDEPWLEETLSQLNSEGSVEEHLSDSGTTATAPLNSVQSTRPISSLRSISQRSESSSGDSVAVDPVEPENDQGGTLSMAVRGKMTLKINYEEDQSLWIATQNGSLQIRLSDGTEFKFPVRTGASKKAA